MFLAHILLRSHAAQPSFPTDVPFAKMILADQSLAPLPNTEAKNGATLELSDFLTIIIVAVDEGVFCTSRVVGGDCGVFKDSGSRS